MSHHVPAYCSCSDHVIKIDTNTSIVIIDDKLGTDRYDCEIAH